MMRSLYSGVAGLKTHQTRMDVIGNNIANVNTTAYKSKITSAQAMETGLALPEGGDFSSRWSSISAGENS